MTAKFQMLVSRLQVIAWSAAGHCSASLQVCLIFAGQEYYAFSVAAIESQTIQPGENIKYEEIITNVGGGFR